MRHPLTQAVPDPDELLANPRAYLEAGPLAFGPCRMYGQAARFALPGVALLVSTTLANRDDERAGAGPDTGALPRGPPGRRWRRRGASPPCSAATSCGSRRWTAGQENNGYDFPDV